jgi:hypothetical protein
MRPWLLCQRPRSVPGCRSSAPEDRKTARADEEPEDDQSHAEEDLTLKELHDPRDDEDYGDDPQDETHVGLLPMPSSSHTRHVRRRVHHDHLPVDVYGYAPLSNIQTEPYDRPRRRPPARWHENCPMAILEPAACGVATIGTHLGGIPELITDGHNGILIPPD